MLKFENLMQLPNFAKKMFENEIKNLVQTFSFQKKQLTKLKINSKKIHIYDTLTLRHIVPSSHSNYVPTKCFPFP